MSVTDIVDAFRDKVPLFKISVPYNEWPLHARTTRPLQRAAREALSIPRTCAVEVTINPDEYTVYMWGHPIFGTFEPSTEIIELPSWFWMAYSLNTPPTLALAEGDPHGSTSLPQRV